jgi:hypothetical protein
MDAYWIVVALSILAQFFVFLRWLHHRMRDDEIQRTFVRDMATLHLPHIYHALSMLAGHHQIQLSEPPPVRFIEFNGAGKYRR